MKRLCTLFAIWLLSAAVPAAAAEHRVPLDGVAKVLRTAAPGDVIIVESGRYADMNLKWVGEGREGAPVTICAESEGAVVIGGKSSLHIGGKFIEIKGLDFLDGDTTSSAVIEFRCGSDVADDCRLTECAIDNYNPSKRDRAFSYIVLYGRRNRVDHCTFAGRRNLGVTLIVNLNGEQNQKNFHRIDHNHFAPRPVYGSNGAETIRIGLSQQAYESSNTIVEDNLFDRCNGEVEVISVKSSDNTIARNVFFECEGVVALRHGDRNTVEDNLFLGNGVRNTGGVRIVNAGHRVRRNTFAGLAGGRFFSALALMNAVPNSLPNRYCLVEDVEVTDNIFVDCSNIEFGTGRDLERTLPPERVLFAGNTIINGALDEPFIAVDRTDGFTFSGNRVALARPCTVAGFDNAAAAAPALPSEVEIRAGRGAAHYKPAAKAAADAPRTFVVRAGEDLPAVVESAPAGSVVELADAGGDYTVSRAMRVAVPLTIRGAGDARPVVRYVGSKSDNLITICGAAVLRVENVAFSGRLEPGKVLPKAGIATAAEMIEPYELYVDGCEFFDFTESGFCAVKGTRSTFALRVEIRNSLFRDLSGDAINFADERDDKGRYSADDMIIDNCSFSRMLGIPVNIYRGGSDESTAGPYVTVSNCNFEDCCNRERGSVLRLIGPQVLDVVRCNFSNSGRGGRAVRLDEATWEKVTVADCNFFNSGAVLSITGTAVKGPVYGFEPRYRDAGHYDFTQQPDSELYRLGIGVTKPKKP